MVGSNQFQSVIRKYITVLNKCKQKGFFRLGAIGAAIAVLSPLACAGAVTILTEAKGAYTLGSGLTNNLLSSTSGSNVDVLAFPGSYGSANSAGLHSYGSPSGNFGSRSSGYGVYDVSGSFQIKQTITNTSAVAQNAVFNFFITPGQLNNDIRSSFPSGDFVTSGLVFDLQKNGSSIWGSSATLTTSSSGTTFTQTGTNLYAGGGAYYAVNGGFESIDLGVLNAGEHFDLSYQLNSFARGNSAGGPSTHVAATSYVVPDQWIENTVCTGGYGRFQAAIAIGYGPPPVCTTTPLLIPAHTVVVPAYDIPSGQASGSTAQSGDPFDVQFSSPSNVIFTRLGKNSAQPVPEPGELALFLTALGLAGWTTRRRRSETSAG